MGILDRLRQWAEIQKVRPAQEPPDVTGGLDGELLLGRLVASSYRFKDAHLLAGRRIPSKRQGRRREIDLIVCTPATIHLVEVKNWSGQLAVRDGRWRQTRRSGEVVDHGDLIEENRLKRDAVVEYLNDRGLGLDDQFVRDHIVTQVVLTNPRLELDPATEARPDVVSRRELDEYLGRRGRKRLAERVVSSLMAVCLYREAEPRRMPAEQFERIVAHLSEAGTWDRLQFYGTKAVTGDLASLTLGRTTYRKPELVRKAGGLPIRLRWTRGRFWGLLKAVTGLGSLGRLHLGKARIEVSPADAVTFQAAGDREPRVLRLVEVDGIVVG